MSAAAVAVVLSNNFSVRLWPDSQCICAQLGSSLLGAGEHLNLQFCCQPIGCPRGKPV